MGSTIKVLVTGGSSLLGRYLHKTKPDTVDLASTWHTNNAPGVAHRMDITDPQQVRHVFNVVKPDVVIHCAANGSVDFAERNFDEARLTNVIGTRNVINAAVEHKAKMIHISSNAVYDGNNSPYNEDSDQKPVNKYGKMKWEAETLVSWRDMPPPPPKEPRYLIIRPFLLYGWPHPNGRGNWAVMVIDALRQGKPVKMVSDHVWMPTYAYDAAFAIWSLILQGRENEAFNIAAPERVTLYEFAVKVAQVWGLDAGLIEPVASDYFQGIAPRPHDTTYDLTKMTESLGGGLSAIEDGLIQMKWEER